MTAFHEIRYQPGPTGEGFAIVRIEGEPAIATIVAWSPTRADAQAVRDEMDVDALSRAFTRQIVQSFEDWEIDEVRARNAAGYRARGCCATHDFCDANMLMDGAFRDTFGRALRGDRVRDMRLINAAWSRSADVHRFEIPVH